MRRLRLLRTPAALSAAVCVLLLAGGAPARAHTALQEATPAPGAKVGPDTRVISLTFGQLLSGTVPEVGLAGPAGEPIPVGDPVVVPGSTVCAAVEGLPVGVVTLTYSVLAPDGDAQTNRYEFQVVADGEAATVPSACRARDLPAPRSARADGGAGIRTTVVAGACAGGAALAVVLGVLAVRRRRRDRPGPRGGDAVVG
ncbi:copper resistance protein CopC [Streptomyces sp. NPDC006700]|uniref:copper resistance CopC family protein n=1 Tax=Streptomyces sp. NPDC006700 TaxID=3154479 RepID=UPI003409C6A2